MLPAIFAVENHTDQHRFIGRDGFARLEQMPHEIVGRVGAVAALIVEADHVAQSVIAENDAKLMLPFTHLVRAVEVAWIADMPLGVAAHKALRRLAQDFLIGGDPANAVLCQRRDHRLTDAPLRRPHPARHDAEQLRMLLHPPPHLRCRVFRVSAGVVWKLHVRHASRASFLSNKSGRMG